LVWLARNHEANVRTNGDSGVAIVAPSAVSIVDSIKNASVARLGALIERHPRFPKRVHVGFAEILAHHVVRLRVYERGAGETHSCGTGRLRRSRRGEAAGIAQCTRAR
jgi:diaminopimelate epimerase